jgi:hypothetical protein
MTATSQGATFQIKVDGIVRTHRDARDTAIEAARFGAAFARGLSPARLARGGVDVAPRPL